MWQKAPLFSTSSIWYREEDGTYDVEFYGYVFTNPFYLSWDYTPGYKLRESSYDIAVKTWENGELVETGDFYSWPDASAYSPMM